MDRFSYSRNGDNGLVSHTCQVRVQIPGVETRGKHVCYQIRVTNVATRQSWDVSRRFSEFLKVRNALLAYFKEREGKKCPGCVNYEKVIRLFEFPRKHVFNSVSPVVLNYRKVALKSFVALLASHTFTEKPKCPTCSGQAFTLVQDFLTQELTAAPATGTVHGPDDVAVSTDAIRESIDVKKFMGTQHPVSKLRPVDSNGKFTTAAAAVRRQQQQPSAGKPRVAAPQKPQPRINAKHAAGEDSDDLPSPPHSSTGSSSGSFGSMASPVAAPVAVPVPVARQPKAKVTAAAEPVEDEEGSFVSFTAPARQKRSSSRRSRNKSITATVSVVVQTKKKSEKKRLNFTRRRSSAAGSQRHSMESARGEDGNDADEDEDEEINMDFLKSVSISA